MSKPKDDSLHFDVSSGLKTVLGSELITDDEVAIFELVKNSFDAEASHVDLYFCLPFTRGKFWFCHSLIPPESLRTSKPALANWRPAVPAY